MSIDTKPSSIPSHLVTVADVAKLARIGENSVRAWIRDGKLPRPFKLGRRWYWEPETAKAFLSGATPPKKGSAR